MQRLDPEQQRLAADHVHLVDQIARRDFGRNPWLMDEVLDAGYLGLCSAARAFDVDRGCGFATYASHRIRGAMRDALRQIRGRSGGGRYVTLDGPGVVALDAAVSSSDDSPTWEDIAARQVCDGPTRAIEVAHLCSSLPPRERRVVQESYLAGTTLRAIAARMGVTESRASQLRTRAVERLRAELGLRGDTVVEDEILRLLASRAPLDRSASVTALARTLHRTETRCRDALRRLELDGYVKRVRSVADVTADGYRRLGALEDTVAA